MRLKTRLERLAQRIGDAGCPACRDRRGRFVWIDVQRMPDGSVTPAEDKPLPCGACGRVAEFVIQVVRPVKDDPEL